MHKKTPEKCPKINPDQRISTALKEAQQSRLKLESENKSTAELEMKKDELLAKVRENSGRLQAAKSKATVEQAKYEEAKKVLDQVQTEVDGLTRKMKEEAEDPKALLKIDLSKLKKVETTAGRDVHKAEQVVKKHIEKMKGAR